VLLRYSKAGRGVNFNSRATESRELYNIPRNRAINHTGRYDFLPFPPVSPGERAAREAGDLKNRRGRKRRMRNELSSALRRFLLCIIHDRARASGPVNYVLRRESFANSSRLALRRQCKETGKRERATSRRGESSDAKEATADFRVIEGIEAGRRVVLLEPAATIINGQGVTPREITSLTSASMPTGQPPAAPTP